MAGQLLAGFRARLDKALARQPPPATWADPRRSAALADHLSRLLFGLLNPVLKSLRALSVAELAARLAAVAGSAARV